MVKTKTEIIRTLSRLKPEDKEDITFCIQQLEQLVKLGSVSEESLNIMYNLVLLLTNMKERHTSYVIALLKQGFIEEM
tara:strand:+ start:309 stop:542 length:234 start_codon:yes stop_codon:yes gene_type:complete